MIKIEENHKCQSYWKGDGLYDKTREKSKKVKIFGITIWQNKESYNCDLMADKNGLGFKL